MDDISEKELLWRQYKMYIDLFKYYLELTLKFNFIYYAITGAILSFYFSQSDISIIKYSLIFPMIMGAGFGLFFLYGAKLMSVVRNDIFEIRDKLNFDSAPDVNVLNILLKLSTSLFLIIRKESMPPF